MDVRKLMENIEFLSEKVHKSWEEEKRSQGFHSPTECPSYNRKSYSIAEWKEKESFDAHFNAKYYKWCEKCHQDLYPYEELDENIKEYDRVTVRTVLNAIKEL
ncbi:hypothetical protein CN978_30085 [Priestia megaterium]|uniref:hypothetical protein n=1 Tax=Priestia megaterium TaxID=1404 RepID=UPI000BFBB8FC|nr:hypothetical protein [Priestia megaterium]PGN53953.1 hypothetical protein CN978_30085 [Priestia megaterium]